MGMRFDLGLGLEMVDAEYVVYLSIYLSGEMDYDEVGWGGVHTLFWR